ncbi:MAG TPA: AAA family ATPase [Blastocatellia bacterium]|nr:AAA family ATPase [Blastocatellia bacterium]
MKLDRITLENFRQYHGKQRLNFSRDSTRNVTVIHGVNGAGKTSLFLAINWCLYGEVASNTGELMSKEAVSVAGEGETISTSVELAFIHDGERYLVSRRLVGEKRPDGSVSAANLDDFTMMRIRRDGQAEPVKNPIGRMNSILPSNVRTYFIFDGEKIDDFARPEENEQVRYAIYNVLKLEVLERARNHLQAVANEYRKELKNISRGELHELVEQEERHLDEKQKAIARKEDLEREIESAKRKISDIDGRLREMQSASGLAHQRDILDGELRTRQSESDQLVSSIRDLATTGFIVIAQSAVEKARSVLDGKRERGEIPSSIRQQFIQDLLERMQCICGRPFDVGGDEHRRLMALMESSLPGSLEDNVLDTAAALRPFSERAQSLKETLNRSMERRADLTDIIRGLEEQLDDVSRQLKGSPQEEISSLEKQREDFRADIESYKLEQGSLETRLESLALELAALKKKIDAAKKDQTREDVLTRKMSLSQRSADAIDQMYQTFADEMRERIEAKTKEVFKLLVWKDSHFQDIKLGPDYKLDVIDRYGLSARPDLSAGERQVLSLSFITAMSRVSEEEAPLVMDTPFGRLSSQHRNNITEHVPELTDQLVLFVTDEELRDQARANLEPRIGAEYRLEFNRATSCTDIVEVTR